MDFLKKIGLVDKFSFASTGGGSILSFLSKEKMPGLKTLVDNTTIPNRFLVYC